MNNIKDTEETLMDLYFLIRRHVGWLNECKCAGFSQEDLLFLEKLDDALAGYRPDDHITEWEKEIEGMGGHQIYFAETDDEKIKLLSEKIADIYRDYEKSMWADEPYVDRAIKLMLSGVKRLEKVRRGIRGQQLHKDEMEKMRADPTYKSDRITDRDIESARAYPIERLIPEFEMSRGGYVKCKWHEDTRPSMLVKNGFAYCFSCQKTVDSIRWLMEVDNMNFVDAVKYLRDRS